MNNTWCRIAVCVFFYIASSASAALSQEMDFVLVSLEQLRDRLERDDKGTLDEFVTDVSTASGLSAAASRDSLVSLLRNLKTHCKKSTALGEQLFALHGAHFSEREAKAYLVRVVDMAGNLLKKEENVGLEPLIVKAASKSKLLKFQALDYTKALLVSFVGSPVVEELAEAESAVKVPTGTLKVLVRTSNSEGLSDQVDRLVEGYRDSGGSGITNFFRVFKVFPLSRLYPKEMTAVREPPSLDGVESSLRSCHGTAATGYNTMYVVLCTTFFFSGMASCSGVVDRRDLGAWQTHGQCPFARDGFGPPV